MTVAEPRTNAPGHPVMRALAAVLLVVVAGVFLLAVLNGLIGFAFFVLTPGAAALFFAGAPPHRDTFVANGIAASFASGLTGGSWVLAGGGDDGTNAVSVIVGGIVSFVILTVLAMLGCALAGKIFLRERKAPEAFEDDD